MQQENDRLRARRFQLELERGDRLQRIVDLEAELISSKRMQMLTISRG
jgi:hypothetical protein